VPAFALLDHPPRRVIGVRQLDRRIGEGAAALGRAELEFGNKAQPGKQLLPLFIVYGRPTRHSQRGRNLVKPSAGWLGPHLDHC
jgi:hypothetical protein